MVCGSRAASFCTASSKLLHKRNEKEVEVTEDNLEILIISKIQLVVYYQCCVLIG